MKKIQLTTFFLCCFLNLFSQKEVYFESNEEKAISISSYKSIETSIGSIVNSSGFTGGFTIGYFTETKIARFTSLIWGVKAINSIYRTYLIPTSNATFDTKYGFQIALLAEPRCYLNYKKRVLLQKTTQLNSAWFISMPLEISSSYIFSNEPFSPYIKTPINIGFRGVFNSNLLWECSGGLGVFSDFTTVTPIPDFKFKVAYTF